MKNVYLIFNWCIKVFAISIIIVNIYHLLTKTSAMSKKAFEYSQYKQNIKHADCIKVHSRFKLKGSDAYNLNIDGHYYNYYDIKFHPKFPANDKRKAFYEKLANNPDKCISGQYLFINKWGFIQDKTYLYIYNLNID